MKLYDFQEKASNYAVNSIVSGRNPLLSSPTGSGKSLIAIDIMRKINNMKVLTYLVSSKKEILWGIEEIAKEKFGIKLSNYLWTPVRLLKKLKGGKIPKPEVIIFDEAHHLHAPGWSVFRNMAKLIGMTATPLRGIEEQIVSWKSYFQEFYSCISIIECILKKILVPFYIYKEFSGKIKLEGLGQQQLRRVSHAFIDKNIDSIFKDIMRLDEMQPRPTIFSTPNITSSLIIKNYFEKRGIRIEVISKDTGKYERVRCFDLLAQNKVWLAALDILTEGIDIPEISRVVGLRPMYSPIPFVQLMGRGLRIVRDDKGNYIDSKLDCEILDYSDNLQRFKSILNDYLGIALKEDMIEGRECFIPDLKEVKNPINDFKSLKFSSISKYNKIDLYVKKRNFVFDFGVIEFQLGKKRWFLSCKENIFTKSFFFEYKDYKWKILDINSLGNYNIHLKDFKITGKDFDARFSSLLNDLIRLYAKPYSTLGLLFSISFLESLVQTLDKYKLDKMDDFLYYINEEIEILDKWKGWIDLIPKPSETESVFFESV